MNDPWDVKSVKQSGQYTSCMKINGVPLLPPVLSKECRKEMQYYKLLAKEIEKRIKFLKPYLVETDTDGSDKTDAPELPDYEQICELPLDNTQPPYIEDVDKITAVITENTTGKSEVDSQTSTLASNVYNNITSNVLLMSPAETPISTVSPKLVIDVNLKISDNVRIEPETIVEGPPYSPMSNELPERDFSSIRILPEKELLTETETVEKVNNKKEREILGGLLDYSIKINKDILNKSDPFPESLTQDGPPSLTSKSFTGSLIDIPTEAVKESHKAPKLIRQRSYTILHPSPQLLAHLEEQYLNSGVEITSISMSESLSNLNSTNKKRRSWDLESAKVKWSSMAIELNQKTASSVKQNINKGQHFTTKVTLKKVSQPQVSPPNKSKSLTQEKPRHASLTAKPLPKSEPIQKAKKTLSPVRNVPSNSTIVKEPAAKGAYHKENSPSQKSNTTSPNQCSHLISESFDPATRVRELYEKIQNQQLLQMANLVEKQKKEQMLLQQVFEEQNNLLYKQLKTICPKSPGGLKEAWVDKEQGAANRGPVRLSQLINHKTAENSPYDSTISSTLTDTNNYINQCDNTLKKSRDISGSIKKKTPTRSQNGSKVQSSSSRPETRTTTHSPYQRNSISRKLQYDTSGSTERDLEPILTDRTNDTMADLNVTFPSDYEDEYYPLNNNNNTVINHNSKNSTLVHEPARTRQSSQRNSTDSAIRSMEETIYKSMNNMYLRKPKPRMFNCEPTPQERAAATKIVAYAKGYLVRRLMRTEQVQATVQTIKDALLCALQLHQDREGIKGADVDLHRRLIQQITAACYALHDTFVASTPSERCATIAADRARRRRRTNSLTSSQTQSYTNRVRDRDIMSQSHSGVFPARVKRTPASSLMTQSNYETFSGSKWGAMGPRRRPWR